MNSDISRKKIILRLTIYIFLSFLPLIILTPVLNNILGGRIFTNEVNNFSVVYVYGVLGMMFPALANILTRIITKEGFKNSLVSLTFKKGKWKYYIMSIAIPMIYAFVSFIIMIIILLQKMSTDEIFNTEDLNINIWVFISLVPSTIIALMPYFGEEFGWRAYMIPKLEELMGTPKAVIFGGILWGLWHAPLTCSGHNFGTDYPFFPYLGIILMCIFCIFEGSILTFLTKRTGSVIPACIVHALNNNAGFLTWISIFCSEKAIDYASNIYTLASFGILATPVIIIGTLCFMLLIKDEKSN